MDWEPTVKLPAKWLSLLEKLWASDEKSIDGFLPEIVALIRATNPSVAVTGLLTVMHSPKVRDCSGCLQTHQAGQQEEGDRRTIRRQTRQARP
jgi:hypothetical protein